MAGRVVTTEDEDWCDDGMEDWEMGLTGCSFAFAVGLVGWLTDGRIAAEAGSNAKHERAKSKSEAKQLDDGAET
jgi:hypothetical protein